MRTITANESTNNIWLGSCSGIVGYSITQTGIRAGDTFHDDPYPTSTFTTAPASTFNVSLGLSNTNSPLCSPGAYAQYVTGTDGAMSNTSYVPIISPWNMWAGNNTVDEFQSDPASGQVCKYKISDGSADGCISPSGLPYVAVLDGNYLVTSPITYGGTDVRNVTTGNSVGGINRSGDVITDIAAKNGVVGYTQSTRQIVSFFNETILVPTVYDYASLGTAPASLAMSTGCSTDPNTASAFVYDQEGTTVYRLDVVKATSGGTVSATKIGSVALNGFSPASQLTTTLARYIVTWDTNCRAMVMAPVITSTNPDGSKNYAIELALVDGTTGTLRQLGSYLANAAISTTAIRMAEDPAGNAVVIASTNTSTGTTSLVKVSWTLDGSNNPTFTTTALASAPPVGVYGVSLGVLPNENISTGQREQHYVLAPQ